MGYSNGFSVCPFIIVIFGLFGLIALLAQSLHEPDAIVGDKGTGVTVAPILNQNFPMVKLALSQLGVDYGYLLPFHLLYNLMESTVSSMPNTSITGSIANCTGLKFINNSEEWNKLNSRTNIAKTILLIAPKVFRMYDMHKNPMKGIK